MIWTNSCALLYNVIYIYKYIQCEAPKIAKLVNITPITMVYGTPHIVWLSLQPLATNKSPSHLDDRFVAIPGAFFRSGQQADSETEMNYIHQLRRWTMWSWFHLLYGNNYQTPVGFLMKPPNIVIHDDGYTWRRNFFVPLPLDHVTARSQFWDLYTSW